MPELPEVETTLRGIEPHVAGRIVRKVIVRQPRLRWHVPSILSRALEGQRIDSVERRAKYLLFHTAAGTAILHLGMSGSLRIVPTAGTAEKHDHVDIVLDSGKVLRLRDPRRFGCLLWTRHDPLKHKLLKQLGPEPLSDSFDGDDLFAKSRGRRGPIKTFIMDSRIVVGVGNIYANEALFIAGIHPGRASGRISRERYRRLAAAIKQVLSEAIEEGGTTLRDFVRENGQPGYFRIKLRVYERGGQPCPVCRHSIKRVVLGQRATYFCSRCQR